MKKYLKAPLIVTFALLCAFVIWIVSAFKTESEAKEALVYFEEGDLEKSQESLEKVREKLAPTRFYLYQTYLFWEGGSIEQAAESLAKAESALDDTVKDREKVELEISLLNILLAYLEDDFTKLEEALQKGMEIDEQNGKILAFQGLLAFNQQDFDLARKAWNTSSSSMVVSKWYDILFDKYFGLNWKIPYQSYMMLQEGNYLEAREYLEEKQEGNFTKDQKNLFQFVLALSYLKEGLEHPGASLSEWIAIGKEKLEGVSLEGGQFSFVKEDFVKVLIEYIRRSLTLKTWGELPQLMDAFEQFSLREGEIQAEEILIEELKALQEKGEEERVLELTQILRDEIDRLNVREEVVALFEQWMLQRIREGEFKGLERYWDALKGFAADSEAVSDRLEEFVLSRIFIVIQREEDFEPKVQPYLNFWKYIEPKGVAQRDLSLELVNFGFDLWDKSADMKKASDCFKLAISFTPFSHREEIKSQIAFHLGTLHQKASEDDRLEELGLIYLLANQLEITEFKAQEKIALANVLADAEFFLSRGDKEEALKRIFWVQRVDPKNQRGLKLLGFIRFREDAYAEAISIFEKIPEPDAETLGLIALSYFKEGKIEEGKKALKKIPEGRKLWAEIHKQVAYLKLLEGEPKKADAHFSQMSRFSEKTLIGRMYALKETGKYEEALKVYLELPENFKNLQGVQFVLIETLAARGNLNDAEKALSRLLEEESAFPKGSFEKGLFNDFYKTKMEYLSVNAFAGKFYKVYAQNYEKALEFFDKESRLPPELVLEKADALYSLGRDSEAEELFVELEKEFSSEEQMFGSLLYSLSEIVAKQKRFIEQKKYLNELLTRDKSNQQAMKALAKAELNLGNYRESRKLYEKLEDQKMLSNWDRLHFLRALFGSGKFQKGGKLALTFLSFEGGYDRLYRLHILDLAVPFIDRAEAKRILVGLKLENEVLSAAEKEMFFMISWKMGQNEQALYFLKDLVSEEIPNYLSGLTKIAEGKLSLGTQYLYKSLETVPSGDALCDMAFSLDPRPNVLSARKNRAITKALKFSGSPNLFIDGALALLDFKEFAPKSFLSSDEELLEQYMGKIEDDRSSRALLAKIRFENLQGKSNLFHSKLMEALSISPSNSLLWKYLALHYESEERWNLAKEAWTFAIKYFPYHPIFYQHLALVLEKTGDQEAFEQTVRRIKELAPELLN